MGEGDRGGSGKHRQKEESGGYKDKQGRGKNEVNKRHKTGQIIKGNYVEMNKSTQSKIAKTQGK